MWAVLPQESFLCPWRLAQHHELQRLQECSRGAVQPARCFSFGQPPPPGIGVSFLVMHVGFATLHDQKASRNWRSKLKLTLPKDLLPHSLAPYFVQQVFCCADALLPRQSSGFWSGLRCSSFTSLGAFEFSSLCICNSSHVVSSLVSVFQPPLILCQSRRGLP